MARYLSKRDEMTGREMKVSRDEIRRWHECMKRLPYETFAADKTDDEVMSGAAFIDYYRMIRKKYQRKN